MKFDKYKNNNKTIIPTLTDDWKIDFKHFSTIYVTSEKLNTEIKIKNSNDVKKFLNALVTDDIETKGGKIIGSYLISKDLILVNEETVNRTENVGFENGFEYKYDDYNNFIYLGEFYVVLDSGKVVNGDFIESLGKCKKVKVGVICKDLQCNNVQYVVIRKQAATAPIRYIEDYGKFLVDIDKKALEDGFYYIGRGKPLGKYELIENCKGKEVIEVEFNSNKYIIANAGFIKYANSMDPVFNNYFIKEKPDNISKDKAYLMMIRRTPDGLELINSYVLLTLNTKGKNLTYTVSYNSDQVNFSLEDIRNVIELSKGKQIKILRVI